MNKLMFCVGSRSEVIKVAPLISEAIRRKNKIKLVVIEQGDVSILPFLNFFGLKEDYCIRENNFISSISSLVSNIIINLESILKNENPSLIFVQGDSNTAMATALAAYHQKIPVVHIEAGLRSYNKYSPFPEEMNRKIISSIADYHFSPTEESKQNLFDEGIRKNVWVTGNTGIDSLRLTLEKFDRKYFKTKFCNQEKKQILVTFQREEYIGMPLESICNALLEIVNNNPKTFVFFPVHPNLAIQFTVKSKLGHHDQISLLEPLGYHEFTELMYDSDIIISDSGTIEEEALYLKKPIFILRETTERLEGVAAGAAIQVGTDHQKIVRSVEKAINNYDFYSNIHNFENPFDDGFSSPRIFNLLNLKAPEHELFLI